MFKHRALVILAVIGILIALLAVPALSADEVRMRIRPLSYTSDGVVSLEVSFTSTSAVNLYSFQQSIFALVGTAALKIDAHDDKGEPLQAESVVKVRPVLPHKDDYVSVDGEYTYPKPLDVILTGSDGKPRAGCVNIRLTYDSTVFSGDRSHRLTLLRVESNSTHVCTEGAM